ncbi:MAG: hypothetical protein OJF50_002445 [Nitrospira sp.]|jgi:hypothetical protein|nr:hypothetical protein [Nitrospira sp.]
MGTKYILSLLLALSLSGGVMPAFGAISCGNVTPFNAASPTDPETIAYTTPAGSDQVLFVFVGNRRTISPNINVPTHAGGAMTVLDAEAFNSPAATKLFYKVNPTSGTNNVVVDFVGTPLADAIVIFTCSGVDTASPIRASNTATGTSTAVSVTVLGVQAGDVVLDFFVADNTLSAPTIGANQTNLNNGSDGTELAWGSSQQDGVDGGVMSWTNAISEQWSISAVAIKPLVAPAAASTQFRRRLMP